MFEISDAKINKKKYSTKDTIDKALQTKLLQKSSFSCFLIETLIIPSQELSKTGYTPFLYIKTRKKANYIIKRI